jgi:hypothetical protein
MNGAATGGVRVVLRLEGLAVLMAALLANAKWGVGWGNFALFFFVPDLSFIGYLAGPRLGAASYDVAHSYIGALKRVSGVSAVGAIRRPIFWLASP